MINKAKNASISCGREYIVCSLGWDWIR